VWAHGRTGATGMGGAATGSATMAEADTVAACDPTAPQTGAGPITEAADRLMQAADHITAAAGLAVHHMVARDLLVNHTAARDLPVNHTAAAGLAVHHMGAVSLTAAATTVAATTTRTNLLAVIPELQSGEASGFAALYLFAVPRSGTANGPAPSTAGAADFGLSLATRQENFPH
jgi:hypothetical protein